MTKEKIKVTVDELIKAQRLHVEQMHTEILKRAEKLGEQDGAMNLPQLEDSQASPNESLIRSEYQKLIADGWKKGKPYLDAPHIEYHTLLDKLDEFDAEKEDYTQKEKDLILQKRSDQETTINREFASKKLEIDSFDKMVKRDYVEAKQHLEDVQERVGRKSPIIHLKSTFLYVLLLMGIGFSEVPLNIQIFQKFGEAFYITIIMACSLAIAIPVLAHFSGVFIKQRKEKKEYATLGIISVLLFIIFNFGVSIFRTYVLAQTTGEAVSNLNIVIFTCLNLILFIIGVLAAYFRHDESYELEYTYKRFQEEKKKYDTEKTSIQTRLKAIESEKNTRLKTVQDTYLTDIINLHSIRDNFVSKRNMAMRKYDELLNAFVALEAYIDASYRIAIGKYRASNLVNRSNHFSPKSWKKRTQALDMKFEACKELDPN